MRGKKRGTRGRIVNILLSLCEAAVGILLLIKPEEFTEGIITFL
ncbi:MAG: hypothetical protein PUD50_10720 [Eubacteriales bacterium]|nr:hypothetical protein [Eubacteriales bacterium]